MKSFILVVVLVGTGLGLFAQKIDKAKEYYNAKKLNEAKTEIEKPGGKAILSNWYFLTRSSLPAESANGTFLPLLSGLDSQE